MNKRPSYILAGQSEFHKSCYVFEWYDYLLTFQVNDIFTFSLSYFSTKSIFKREVFLKDQSFEELEMINSLSLFSETFSL